jgi:hypothetical protein
MIYIISNNMNFTVHYHIFFWLYGKMTHCLTEIRMSQANGPKSKCFSIPVDVSFLNMSTSKYPVFVIILVYKKDANSFLTNELKFKIVVSMIHFCIFRRSS